MVFHLSVSQSVYMGVSAWVDTPQADTPLGRYPQADTPSPEIATEAAGTHTRMHSCFVLF